MTAPAGELSAPPTDPLLQPIGRHHRLGYVPGLDGLRGIAVIAVLLFHGGVSWARGGFLGVDMFFVLSGFLITSLLLDEQWLTDKIKLSAFWARRARRLLPALLVLLVAMAGYAAWVPTQTPLGELRKDVFATLAYVSNWHFIANGSSYFARNAPPSPLRHTWSLAIEEQFYVIWPLLVLAVARGRHRLTKLAVLIGVGTVASVAAMVALYHPGQDASRAYYGTDTRAHVILVGAGLAVLLAALARRREDPSQPFVLDRWTRALLAMAAVDAALIIAWAMWYADGDQPWLYRGGFLGIAAATAMLIATCVLARNGVVSKALSVAPLRAVGRISYGLYLWHWPVYLVLTSARTGLQGAGLLGVRLGTTLAISVVSLYAIELPFRKGFLPHWRSRVMVVAACAAVVLAIVYATDLTPATRVSTASAAVAGGGGNQTTATSSLTTPTSVPIVSSRPLRAAGKPVKVMVLGDSVGLTLTQGLSSSASRYDVAFINNAVLGCGIVKGGPYRYFGEVSKQLKTCDQWPTKWAQLLTKSDPDVVEVVVGRWEVMDRVVAGNWTHLGDPVFDAQVKADLEQSFDILSARGAVVAYLTAPYYLRGERPDGGRWPEDDPARVDAMNALIRGVVAAHPGKAAVVDLNGHTAGASGTYSRVVDGVVMRSDGVHFTPEGARWLAPWLLPELHALGPASSTSAGGATSTTLGVVRSPTTVPRSSTTVARVTTTRPRSVTTTATTVVHHTTTTTPSSSSTASTTESTSGATSTTVRSTSTSTSAPNSTTSTTVKPSTTTTSTTAPATTSTTRRVTTTSTPGPTLP